MQFNDRSGALATLNTTYDAAALTIVLSSGHGARIPATPCLALWYNSTDYSFPTDDPLAEVIAIDAVSTDTLTIRRAQCGTSAGTKNTGGKTYKLAPQSLGQSFNTFINQTGVAHTTIGDAGILASDFKTTGIMTDLIAGSTSGNNVAASCGTGTAKATVGGALNSQYSAAGVGNSGNATDDTLFTYTIPANTLKNVGDWVRVTSYGLSAANSHTCLVKSWFGGTAFVSSGNVTSSAAFPIKQVMTVIKTAANTQMVFSDHNVFGTTANIAAAVPTAAAITDTATIIVKCTGQCTTASEILGSGMIVEFGGNGAGL